MTHKQVEEVFLKETADSKCDICEGEGIITDNDAYGTQIECYCVQETRRELHADNFQQD